MAVIRMNAQGDKAVPHRGHEQLERALETAARDAGPVVVMINGFKHQPGNPYHCPHRHILSLDPDHLPWRAPSWPRHLGFGLGHVDEGLAIAFG